MAMLNNYPDGMYDIFTRWLCLHYDKYVSECAIVIQSPIFSHRLSSSYTLCTPLVGVYFWSYYA